MDIELNKNYAINSGAEMRLVVSQELGISGKEKGGTTGDDLKRIESERYSVNQVSEEEAMKRRAAITNPRGSEVLRGESNCNWLLMLLLGKHCPYRSSKDSYHTQRTALMCNGRSTPL